MSDCFCAKVGGRVKLFGGKKFNNESIKQLW